MAERRRVRAAHDDVRLGMVALDDLGDERHAAAVRGPARHAVRGRRRGPATISSTSDHG